MEVVAKFECAGQLSALLNCVNFGAKEREQRVLCLFGHQGIKFQTSTTALDVYAMGWLAAKQLVEYTAISLFDPGL